MNFNKEHIPKHDSKKYRNTMIVGIILTILFFLAWITDRTNKSALYFGIFFLVLISIVIIGELTYKQPYKLTKEGIVLRKKGLILWSSIKCITIICSKGGRNLFPSKSQGYRLMTYSVQIECDKKLTIPVENAWEAEVIHKWANHYNKKLKQTMYKEISILGIKRKRY